MAALNGKGDNDTPYSGNGSGTLFNRGSVFQNGAHSPRFRLIKPGLLFSLLSGAVAMFAVSSAYALDITPTNDADTLLDALLGANSGISIVPGSVQFVGASTQSGVYTDFSLTPSNGGVSITNPDGILLTTGSANLPLSNTQPNFGEWLGTGGNAQLTSLDGKSTNDQNYLSFSFTVDDPSLSAISTNFVFGSDEYPEYAASSYTDIFGFFVDGTNYAFFPDGSVVAVYTIPNFQDNQKGGYGIEYDGLTTSLPVVGLLDPGLSTHTLTIAIADTGDSILDSGVFIGAFSAGISFDGCSGVGCILTPEVPEPETYAMLLAGLGVLGAAAKRRRKV
jgi:hypothetical protein